MGPNDVRWLVVHTSGTQPNPDEGAEKVDLLCRARGAFANGYHFVIKTDGTVEEGRPMDKPGNHCIGLNDRSIGICLIGGRDKQHQPADTRTPEQTTSLKKLLRKLGKVFRHARAITHTDLRPQYSPDCTRFKV